MDKSDDAERPEVTQHQVLDHVVPEQQIVVGPDAALRGQRHDREPAAFRIVKMRLGLDDDLAAAAVMRDQCRQDAGGEGRQRWKQRIPHLI